jgi:hypothetical protein
MKKLLPIILALIGTGAGVGAGIFLMPKEPEHPVASVDCVVPTEEVAHETPKEEKKDGPAEGAEYVKLSNQFVIPVLGPDQVNALVVASLSIEVPTGSTEAVYSFEPKLRDVMLQVLFDHANIGGFEGAFTSGERMDILRSALLDAAHGVLGDQVNDVLITEIARQDV